MRGVGERIQHGDARLEQWLDVDLWVSSDRCACPDTARPQVKFASFAQNDLVTLFDRANPMLLPVCARNDRYAARAGDRQIR